MRGLMIAAPKSGSGKTLITIALVAALKRRGVAVQTAKTGPDYIDPVFHQAASARPGFNLDSWAMSPELMESLIADAASGADLLVIEAAMGLFDGVSGPDGRTGAAADIAKHFGIPIVLVLDVAGQAQSAAAVVQGCAAYRPGVTVAGVVLNRVGSERHRSLVAEAITAAGHRVLGSIPRENSLALPQRHLGLVQAREHPDLGGLIERLAERAEGCLDLDALTACATSMDTGSARVAPLPPPGQRIAIASDDAFTFMYPHLLRAWRKAGAEILLFSPLANEAPPLFCDVCWLPGGYPELHAGRIAGSERFLAGIRQFAEKNRVHGECGGYMVLGEAIIDASGESHAMAGLLGHVTSFAERKLCLGYRTATLLSDCAVGAAGLTVRGHEFHYATIAVPGAESPLVRLANGEGEPIGLAGGIRGRVSGTFFHALAASESGGASPRE